VSQNIRFLFIPLIRADSRKEFDSLIINFQSRESCRITSVRTALSFQKLRPRYLPISPIVKRDPLRHPFFQGTLSFDYPLYEDCERAIENLPNVISRIPKCARLSGRTVRDRSFHVRDDILRHFVVISLAEIESSLPDSRVRLILFNTYLPFLVRTVIRLYSAVYFFYTPHYTAKVHGLAQEHMAVTTSWLILSPSMRVFAKFDEIDDAIERMLICIE